MTALTRADVDRYCAMIAQAFERGALTPQQTGHIRREPGKPRAIALRAR